jgi:hypothetical protein
MSHIRHANIPSRLDNDCWGQPSRSLDERGLVLIHSPNDGVRCKRAGQSAKHAEQE